MSSTSEALVSNQAVSPESTRTGMAFLPGSKGPQKRKRRLRDPIRATTRRRCLRENGFSAYLANGFAIHARAGSPAGGIAVAGGLCNLTTREPYVKLPRRGIFGRHKSVMLEAGRTPPAIMMKMDRKRVVGRKAKVGRRYRVEGWLLEAETEPYRRHWLTLSPGARLLRSWRMRRSLKKLRDPEDALPLPLS